MPVKSPVYVEEFSSAFQTDQLQPLLVSKRFCCDHSVSSGEMQMGYPIDADTLMHKYDLSSSAGYQVKVKSFDFTPKENLDEFSLPRVEIEDCPKFDCEFLSSSNLANLFTPEFTLSRFRGVKLRRSKYIDLIRHLSKSGFDLYFSGILQFEAELNGQVGEGLISIYASVPEYNMLFGHLKSKNYI